MSAAFEQPKARKGYVLTSVIWNRAGRISATTYEPIRRAAPAVQAEPKTTRRGALAAEQRSLL